MATKNKRQCSRIPGAKNAAGARGGGMKAAFPLLAAEFDSGNI